MINLLRQCTGIVNREPQEIIYIMTLHARAKKEIVFQISRFIPIRINKGPCAGMRLYGNLFYNRRRDNLNDEEFFYQNLDLENKVVIDGGAHIGIFTMLFARKVHNGKVLAFEPNPISFSFLRKNVFENSLQNVIAINAGLSNKMGKLSLVSDRYNTAKGTLKIDKQELLKARRKRIVEVTVPVMTVDEAVDNYALGRVDFVKIDTEGFEPYVIEGMTTALEKSKPIIYFEIHGLSEKQKKDDLKRIWSFIKSYDYHLVRLTRDIPRVTNDNMSEFGGGGYVAFFTLTLDLKNTFDYYKH